MMKKVISVGIICLLLIVSLPSIIGIDKELPSMHENHPPGRPNIDGPQSIRPGTYNWTFKAIDPDGDNVSYEIDWDDGEYEDWFGPFISGKKVKRNHTYYVVDTIALRARAKDIHGAIGEWGHFLFEIPKSEPTIFDDEFEIEVTWETYYNDGWIVQFIVTSNSTLDRIEFFINDRHHETITGSGPVYELSPICWSKTLASSTFMFVGYDTEGNSDTVIIDGSDIKSYPWNMDHMFDNIDMACSGTIVTLEPPEPDGENGWYVNDVEVTLNATSIPDVKEIKYKIGSDSWQTIPGDYGSFIVDVDDTNLEIQYYAVDIYSNEEDIQSFTLNMDQTEPDIDEVTCEAFLEDGIWYIEFICDATDCTSGMDRVEMYIDDEHIETIEGSEPVYRFVQEWSEVFYSVTFWFYHFDIAGNVITDDIQFHYFPPPPTPFYIGLIRNPVITEENISFYAILVFSNHDGILIKKNITISREYVGYIGKLFIWVDKPTFPPE